ncbi:MAG: hypothetical protein ABJ381_06820 [Ilumatobacter sp.]|uniref:hypothetical protein n=1 Tax=Ilumatobacter sp. TaxID=1967498 RepID=UPI00329A6793
MRRAALSLLVAACGALIAGGAIGAAATAPIDDGVTVAAPAVRIPATSRPPTPTGPDPALLVSDSAWLGMQTYAGVDQVQGFEHTLSLASCRRRVATSCTNYNGYVPITLYEEVEAAAPGFRTLIVATGYNDGDARFAEDVEAVAELARSKGYRRIVWLTLRSNVSYTSPGDTGFAEVFERSNATLKQIVADGTHPEIVVADWATYARDQPSWFAGDGIHLRLLGGYAAGDYISRKMAFLDARACPQPAYAGVAPLDPCPDPDEHGPVIDLASIYPTDRGQGLAFTLLYEGSSSWPDPPWWESAA